MYGRKPIRWQLRALVIGICTFMLLGFVVIVVVLRAESREVTHLTTVIGPARERNSVVLQAMVDARSALTIFEVIRDPAQAKQLAGARARAADAQREVRELLANESVEPDRRREYAGLQARRDGALAAWLYYADRAHSRAVAGMPADPRTEIALFDRFRAAHTDLAATLTAELRALRAASRDVVASVTLVALVMAACALLGSLLMARRAAGSLTVPIAALRAVVQRIRAGDSAVTADEKEGAPEVRELAAAVNTLTRHNNELLTEQTENLRLHQVALGVEYDVREAATLQQALEAACEGVGPALKVQRLVVSLVDDSGHVIRAAQWHEPGLADFPPDVSPFTGPVAERLWSSGVDLVVTDTREDRAEHVEWLDSYRREAGASAFCLVPIGLAERVLGTISAITLDDPRDWTAAEVALLHHVAAFLAHTVAQAEYRTHQTEYVARLERLDQQKNEFLSTVSHELRTPLTSITGYLELIADGAAGEVSASQQRMLDVIHRNAVRLRGLIEDLLVMNRVEADALRLTTSTVPMAELLEQTVEELQPQAGKSGVRLCLSIGKPGAATVLADRPFLQRALLNVLANAIKFTPSGGTVEATLAVDPETGEVTVRCADTGIGIPRSELDQLATRFFRASNATRGNIPGTGLGLAIVKAIVDAHKGNLVIDSAEGKGTTVTMWFPAAPRPAAEAR